MMWDDVLLTYTQAEKIAEALIFAGQQEGGPVTLEEAKELAKHLYYRTSTKPRDKIALHDIVHGKD